MAICKNCGVEAKIKFLFCPICGIRGAFEFPQDARDEGWVQRVRKRLFKSDVEKAIDEFFQYMTPFGYPEGERNLECLLHQPGTHSLNSMQKERVRAALALGYGIRAQFAEWEKGDPEEAIEVYGDAIRAAPKEAQWYEAKADATYRLARYLDNYQKHHFATFMGPNIGKLQKMLASKKTPEELYEYALEAYSNAIQCDPYHAPALIGRAKTLDELGNKQESREDYKAAIAILTRALSVNPGDLASLKERAEAFEALGQIDRAIMDLKSSIALKKDEWLERRIKELEDITGST